MKNIGWYFYRNYLTEAVVNEIYRTKEKYKEKKKQNEEIQKIFEKRNEPILNTIWENSELVSTITSNQTLDLKTTYPGLFSGSGIAHDISETGAFKLGFMFDHTTGQPYLPGSSVKGTIRSAFPFRLAELASRRKKKEETHKDAKRMFEKAQVLLEEYFQKNEIEKIKTLTPKQIFLLEWEIFEGVKITNIEAIWDDDIEKIKFSNIKTEAIESYERDIFYDAFIKEANTTKPFLASDFITPHKHKDRNKKHLDALVNPVPIQFLKILPNVTFQFNFDLKDGLIKAEEKKIIFRQILRDFGIGAKTNVGYGQFE